ncbi:transporter [Allofournierella sp.]|mgnify:CR=1 FL=1|uniref:transporter n=1 Tax=Allofournierella sp. TaxID=1940256 RepID=UPI003AB769A4
MRKNKRALTLLALHLLLLVYSFSGCFSKTAAGQPFLSLKFILLYGGTLVILAVYALGWQQIIKRLPLTTAFANKAVTVVWGIVCGALFFGEAITPGKLAGAALIIGGVVLFVKADGEENRLEE